jgi:hypothetical protein
METIDNSRPGLPKNVVLHRYLDDHHAGGAQRFEMAMTPTHQGCGALQIAGNSAMAPLVMR